MWNYLLILLSVYGYRTVSSELHRRIHDPFVHIRVIGSAHAIATTLLSTVYLMGYLHDSLFSTIITLVSPGYFILDLAHLGIYAKKYGRNVVLVYLFHHMVCIGSVWYHPTFSYVIARGYLSEMTTPLLNLSWYWRRKHQLDTKYFVNGVLIISLFVVIRLVNIGELWWMGLSNGSTFYSISSTGMLGLNGMWTYKLIEAFREDYRRRIL